MKAKITKRLVESLQPKHKIYSVYDSDVAGFQLRVQPSGVMSWYLSYRNADGQRAMYRIGGYPGLQPEGARRLALEAAGQVAARVDVQAEKQSARAEAERSKVATLGAFIEQRYRPWLSVHLRGGDAQADRLASAFHKWLDEPLSSFNAWRIESWRKDRLKTVKPNTVNRQIRTLRGALTKAVEWGVLDTHPLATFKHLKVDDDERVRFLTPAEEKHLRDALLKREANLRGARERFNAWREKRRKPTLAAHTDEFVDHLRPIVLVALNTGLRRGELFSLRWSDLDFEHAILTVRAAAAKSGDSRRVPLNEEAARVLKAWKNQLRSHGTTALPEAFVFPGENGKRLTDVKKSWATVHDLAKLRDFHFHDLRHSFASKLVQRGVDLNTVRALLGHADLKMTLRYSHLAPDNLAAAVAKLG